MALGPGKYDDLCTLVRLQADADAAIVIVLGGRVGNGFDCQGSPELILQLPGILRSIADQIETDTKS
jgi:hypothetical protein